MKKLDIAVIGAGPAGIGAARELRKLEEKGRIKPGSWQVFEAAGKVGGLSASRKDKNGFTWDLGGHVIFSRHKGFNKLVEGTLGDEALYHTRSAHIRMDGRFIPFPLQNNIHRLPKKKMRECYEGMVQAAKNDGRPAHFRQWIEERFGPGLAEHFMLPYNKKVWDWPLDDMSYRWIGDRVALPDLKDVRRAMKTGRDITGWGPNSRFVFPLYGGTGGLFEKLAGPVRERIEMKSRVTAIDAGKKILTFQNGQRVKYKTLITTMPLDRLARSVISDAPESVRKAATELKSNGGWMVGIGLDRPLPGDRCWVYFPQSNAPFYRVTYFAHYSPNNVPGRGHGSLLCEISMGAERNIKKDDVFDETEQGLVASGILRDADRAKVVSRWKERLPYVYPIPTLGRDGALKVIRPWLAANGIHSVGRFGGWRYEQGNMDHSYLAGASAARRAVKRIG